MRTKTLLGAAVLAAGIASTMAQSNVYSLNVVGYYNIPVTANVKLIVANQLAVTPGGTSDTLSNTLPYPGVPAAANMFKYVNGGFQNSFLDDVDLIWEPNASFVPGEGGFFVSPVNTTITFVGEVLQGSLTNKLPAGIKVLTASIVAQQGLVSTDLGVPADPGDNIFYWRKTSPGGNPAYVNYFYDDVDLAWEQNGNMIEPTNSVGEGMFYIKSATGTHTNWIRNFTVQ
jgi:hypothetical protein